MNMPCLIEFIGILHFEIRLWLVATFSSKKKSPKYRQNSKMAAKNSKMAAILMIFWTNLRTHFSLFWFLFSTKTCNLVDFWCQNVPNDIPLI